MHPAQQSIETLLDECSVKRTRGSGPGGQHRNKVETAIVITHDSTGIVGQASEKRSQNQNKDAAIVRLRINLALGVRTDIVEDQITSELWRSRIRSRKIQVSVLHSDFPSLLSEALDWTFFHSLEIALAASSLGLSTSQLVKFIKLEPAAFEMINREREKIGMRRLK